MSYSYRKQPSLALMCKSHDYEYQPATNTFVTGKWVISNSMQQELLGKQVILTESQEDPAYLGGTILGFVPVTEKTAQTKCRVVFSADPSLVGDTSSVDHSNWGNQRSVCYIR